MKLLPVVISVKSQSVVESPSLPTGEKTKDEEDLGDQPQTSETVNSICSNESAGAPAGLPRVWDVSLHKFAV